MTFLEIAGVSVVLEGDWAEAGELLEQFAPYRVQAPTGSVVRVFFGPAAGAPDRDAPVKLFREGAWMTAAPDAGTLRIGGDRAAAAVERLFMHGFAAVLAARGALLVHAAAVEGPRGAIAFLGPSEAGKTTAARNCPARQLHPDRVAIGMDLSGAWLAPVPFLYGEPRSGSVGAVRLHSLVWITKAARNSVDLVPARDRARLLCSSVLLPPDPGLGTSVLESVVRVCVRVPMQVLHARRDGGFWPLLTARESSIASTQESD